MEPRLEGLDSQARTYLDAAAVAGRTFDPFMVQQISGLDRAQFHHAVDELVNRGLIRAERRMCEFAHKLLRESVCRELNFLECLELMLLPAVKVVVFIEQHDGAGLESITKGLENSDCR